MIDKSPYRKKLPKLIGSFALIAFAILATLNSFIMAGTRFDIDLINYIIKISVPSAACLAFIAYLVGRILDKRTNRISKSKTKYEEFDGTELFDVDIDGEAIGDSYQIKSIFAPMPDEIPEVQPEEVHDEN